MEFGTRPGPSKSGSSPWSPFSMGLASCPSHFLGFATFSDVAQNECKFQGMGSLRRVCLLSSQLTANGASGRLGALARRAAASARGGARGTSPGTPRTAATAARGSLCPRRPALPGHVEVGKQNFTVLWSPYLYYNVQIKSFVKHSH